MVQLQLVVLFHFGLGFLYQILLSKVLKHRVVGNFAALCLHVNFLSPVESLIQLLSKLLLMRLQLVLLLHDVLLASLLVFSLVLVARLDLSEVLLHVVDAQLLVLALTSHLFKLFLLHVDLVLLL